MNAEEQFFFDLQGYLVIDDVLSLDDVAELNGVLDEWERPNGADTVEVRHAYQRHVAFRRLIDHAGVMPYLLALVGPTVRLDHDVVRLTASGGGAEPIRGGAEPYDDTAVYQFQTGRMFNGVVVVSYALVDAREGDGGFVAVPGSHKSNFPFPAEWRETDEAAPWLRPVRQKAGSALVYTAALARGRAPWTAAREHRCVELAYSPGAMSWGRSYPMADDAPDAAWSDRQRSLLEPPYFQNRSFVAAATEGD